MPIRTIASLTGVNPVTLRAWERRYGLIRPLRTPKGHRLYTRKHVDLIQRVLALVERGVAIGQVSEALIASERERSTLPGRGPWRPYMLRMADAVARFDERAVDEVYDAALSLHSVQRVSKSLIAPLLIHLGARWENAVGAVAQEHFFAVYLRNKLGARLHHRYPLTTGPRLLAACAPGEQHEIGLLLFALAAHDSGLRVVLLGADTPLKEMAVAVRQAGCKGLVISTSIEPASGLLERELPEFVRELGVPVYVGGATAVRRRAAIAAAGAVPIGSDIDSGVRAVSAAFANPGKKP